MVAKLEGGCRVTGLKEGEPVVDGALRIWRHFGPDTGAVAISLRVLELDGVATLRNDAAEEVLYVIDENGTANGQKVAVNSGIYLPPGTSLELDGALTLVSSVCEAYGTAAPCRTPGIRHGAAVPYITSLDERPLQRTGDRWYRELITQQVTQFVGVIPPGRAPDHYHLYEEVICILDGEGTMWAGESNTPIAAGSCIFLPRTQVHCLENKGTGDMRLLGVFYPAGSPAVRYAAT
jgi:mannose-6-phosphate isomerase-like protein (cupin superfamily)